MLLHATFAYSDLEFFFYKWHTSLLGFCFFLILIVYMYLKLISDQVLIHWPIVDVLPYLILNLHRIHDWSVEILEGYGGTTFQRGPYLARFNILYTCDPRNVEYIVKTNFSNFPKGSDYKESFDILGDGIINVDSDIWHSHRRLARMAFSSKKVRFIINNSTQKVVQDALLPLLVVTAKQSKVVDIQDVFLRYTFDTSFSVIFGRNPNYLSISFPPHEFANAMDDSLNVTFYRHMVPIWWWKLCRWLMVGNEIKMKNATMIIDHYMEEFMKEKRNDMVKETEASDLMQVYMSLTEGEKDETLSKISSDKFLRDTALTMLFAGRDTTASALTWFFWLVSKNPWVEEKILEELNLVYSKSKKVDNDLKTKRPWMFDADDVTGMVYLHAAICECLRLYPSVPLTRRSPMKADILPNGAVVRPGMKILISNYAMGRMEWVWGKDCLEFKPERWINKDGKLNHETMSKLMAFNIGQRICIGKDMAFVLIKCAASSILFNFHVEVLEGQTINPGQSIALPMKNGLMVKMKERIM